MKFELTENFITSLQQNIQAKNSAVVTEQLKELFPADIAEILNKLPVDQAKYTYTLLPEQLAADVLIEMNEDIRE